MSYRLIDANAIASQRPEVNDMPCVYADLPSGLDGGHYDMRESDELQRENAKLRKLVRDMFYAVHPADREKFLTNVAELGVDDG